MVRFEWRVDVKKLFSFYSDGLFYEDRKDGLRELIQNAVDSGTPRIDVRIGNDFVEVEDFGEGMDEEEIQRYLLTIGATSKRGPQYIGIFGIGFLAAFCLGDVVKVETGKKGKGVSLTITSDGRIDAKPCGRLWRRSGKRRISSRRTSCGTLTGRGSPSSYQS